MKNFHVSDLLTVTTGRLVSSRHMDGVYDILNFLTGDSLFTHQLPRAMKECEPWLRAQFPDLFPESLAMERLIRELDATLSRAIGRDRDLTAICADWVESVRVAMGLPEQIPVYELGADMHTRIDPVEEANAMVGEQRIIVVDLSQEDVQ